MTRADDLREALAVFDKGFPLGTLQLHDIHAAARFALRVWEGDQQLVERIEHALRQRAGLSTLVTRDDARAVLAAITEGEEK